jgi:hypothetical protein
MMSSHAALTLQLLEWVADKPRTHAELMEAWKTTCPRFSIWEDACAESLIGCEPGREGVAFLTDKGKRCLLVHALTE